MVDLKYFGELGYLCIFVLPAYEKYVFASKCIIHTYDDYANILSLYKKENVEFVRYPFVSEYRCCSGSYDVHKKRNLALHLRADYSLASVKMIGKLEKCLDSNINIGMAGKILLFPRMRRNGDYGGFDKSLYDSIIKIFSDREIILFGHKLESYDMTEYNLRHIEINEVVNACKTADMCITPDSGMASLLIASGVKKVIIILNEGFVIQNNKMFHFDIYEKTAKWFKTNYFIVGSAKIIEFLTNGGYNKNCRLYLDTINRVDCNDKLDECKDNKYDVHVGNSIAKHNIAPNDFGMSKSIINNAKNTQNIQIKEEVINIIVAKTINNIDNSDIVKQITVSSINPVLDKNKIFDPKTRPNIKSVIGRQNKESKMLYIRSQSHINKIATKNINRT